jgi:translation initiation factor IF-2
MHEHPAQRPPIVVVLGHVDHGKSSLLDYIRKENTVAGEAGGITQHTAAYEVTHRDASGAEKKLTFIDTPGHEAFAAQRSRGASVADIAILVVSAEDGVKAQTLEAYGAIQAAGIPCIVAVNKIDSEKANVERTVASLTENSIFLEGFGGSIPFVPVSAKRGDGIDALLEMVSLVADLEELPARRERPAQGVIIETHRDAKKGLSATLIIQNGTLSKGMVVASGESLAPVRVIYDFNGTPVDSATVSAPVTIVGWNSLPAIGEPVSSFATKKEAEAACAAARDTRAAVPAVLKRDESEESDTTDSGEKKKIAVVPVIVKADVAGSLDALTHEIEKISAENVRIKILHTGIGPISENDVKRGGGDARTILIGFNTSVEPDAVTFIERFGMTVHTDTIIYKLMEWFSQAVAQRRPKETVQEVHGEARVLRLFSELKTKQVIGARVENGTLHVGDTVSILRREEEIGRGKILELQKQRSEVKTVGDSDEFGTKIDSPVSIAFNDRLHAYTLIER